VLLVGNPSARPTGLERALTRAGFQLVEHGESSTDPEVDAILITLNDSEEGALSDLLATKAAAEMAPPRIVIFAGTDRDAPATALSLGAADALAAPVHLPELCARLHARTATAPLDLSRPGALNGGKPAEPAEESSLPDDALKTLDQRMREEFERARRYSLSFSLVLLGVDEIHSVRERLGPEAADRLRREVADVLRRELRVPDFVTSYGSSEFAIVLPETGPAGARQSVIRVRERLAVVPSEGDPRLDHPRFSAGIVTYPHPAVSQSDELYAMVEAALMRGKAQSGERIGVAV
jgi:diguanylate cyclase (GGDEF)-like protein